MDCRGFFVTLQTVKTYKIKNINHELKKVVILLL